MRSKTYAARILSQGELENDDVLPCCFMVGMISTGLTSWYGPAGSSGFSSAFSCQALECFQRRTSFSQSAT